MELNVFDFLYRFLSLAGSRRKKRSSARLRIFVFFAGVGFWSLLGGERYLDYDALAQEPLAGQHLGVFLVELGVGITVAAVMITVFVAFAGRTPD